VPARNVEQKKGREERNRGPANSCPVPAPRRDHRFQKLGRVPVVDIHFLADLTVRHVDPGIQPGPEWRAWWDADKADSGCGNIAPINGPCSTIIDDNQLAASIGLVLEAPKRDRQQAWAVARRQNDRD
jgi:hypothetical protein